MDKPIDYAALAAGVREHIRFRENSVPRVPSVAELREWADAFDKLTAAQQQGQGGGEVVAWIGAGHLLEQQVNASRAGYGMPLVASTARRGEDCIPLYTAPPSAPVGVELDAAALGRFAQDAWMDRHLEYPAWGRLTDAERAAWVAVGERIKRVLAQQPAAVDEAMVEEANERMAIAAYEKFMGVRADDPAYGPDLYQWMAGWNAALATQHQEPTT